MIVHFFFAKHTGPHSVIETSLCMQAETERMENAWQNMEKYIFVKKKEAEGEMDGRK